MAAVKILMRGHHIALRKRSLPAAAGGQRVRRVETQCGAEGGAGGAIVAERGLGLREAVIGRRVAPLAAGGAAARRPWGRVASRSRASASAGRRLWISM